MYKTYLNQHFQKNFKNYLISNFIFYNKKIELNNYVKFYFFYNTYIFYLAVFIIFNFWIRNLFMVVNKNKLTLIQSQINFFFSFSLYFYPYLFNLKIYTKQNNNFLYFTFIINRFFFNPLFLHFNKNYNLNVKKTFNLLKLALFLQPNQYFFLHFYFNFFQVPFFKSNI